MLEQKQIDEMSEDIARMLCEIYRPNCDEYQPHSCSKCYVNSTPIGCFAEDLYNAGYRKQSEDVTVTNVGCKSEWISVEERLPDNCRAVLVALEGLTIGGAPAMVIGSYSGGIWMVADADGTHYLTKYMRYKVPHWMPLPEAPKGGAE